MDRNGKRKNNTSMDIREAAVKLGITRYQIRYWIRTGLIEGQEGRLSFTDLKKIRFLKNCLNHGVSVRTLRQSIRSLSLSHPDREWYSYLEPDSGLLYIKESGLRLEPVSGQLLFGYSDPPESGSVLNFDKAGWSDSSRLTVKETEYLESLSQNDDSLSEKLLLEILKEKPSHRGALIEMGNLRFDQNVYEEALDYYSRALQTDPDCVEALYNMANICFRQKKYAAAIRYFERSLEIDPDFPESYYNLGLLYFTLGYLDRAEFYLTAYTLLDDDSEWKYQAEEFLDKIQDARRNPSSGNKASSVLPLYNL